MALGGAARSRRMRGADHAGCLDANYVSAPIDHLDQLTHIGRVKGPAVLWPAGCGPAIAKQQARQAKARRHELFQPQRCRRKSAGELRHKSDARLADAAADFVGFVRVEVERGRAVNRFARVARREDWQCAVPTSGEQ
jgi:hypothetical protein